VRTLRDDMADDMAAIFLDDAGFAVEMTYVHDGVPSTVRAILDENVDIDRYSAVEAAAVATLATADVPEISEGDILTKAPDVVTGSVIEDEVYRVVSFERIGSMTRALLGKDRG